MPVDQLDLDAVWLDVECGGYTDDLPHWLALADATGGTVVDVGAGVGRVSIPLALAGHEVIAVELDAGPVKVLRDRARELGLVFDAVCQDARELWLPRRVPLIIVPCSTLQMLGPRADRGRFLERVSLWLEPGGCLAVALHADAESWKAWRDGMPEPDVLERDGHTYVSQTTGLSRGREWIELWCERSVDGSEPVAHSDRLWRLTPRMLAVEAAWHGLVVTHIETRSDDERDDAVFIELTKRAQRRNPA